MAPDVCLINSDSRKNWRHEEARWNHLGSKEIGYQETLCSEKKKYQGKRGELGQVRKNSQGGTLYLTNDKKENSGWNGRRKMILLMKIKKRADSRIHFMKWGKPRSSGEREGQPLGKVGQAITTKKKKGSSTGKKKIHKEKKKKKYPMPLATSFAKGEKAPRWGGRGKKRKGEKKEEGVSTSSVKKVYSVKKIGVKHIPLELWDFYD